MKYTYEQPEYLDLAGARHLVQELKKYIQQIMDGNLDVSSYIKKEDLASYATKSYVDTVVTEVAIGEEVDTLIENNSSGGEIVEPDTPTGTSTISGNPNLRCSYSRTYTGKFFDANDGEVADAIGTWQLQAHLLKANLPQRR